MALDLPPLPAPTETSPQAAPTRARWREQALARAVELEQLAASPGFASPQAEALVATVSDHLDDARRIVARGSVRSAVTGSDLLQVEEILATAEETILRRAPDQYLAGQLPSLLVPVRSWLPASDPRRATVEALAARGAEAGLSAADRRSIATAVRAARQEERRALARVLSFRTILLATTAALTIIAIGLCVVGLLAPDVLPLCFASDSRIVCPSAVGQAAGLADVSTAIARTAAPADIAVVELCGVLSASIAAAAALRQLPGTSTAYGLPIAAGLLKLPTGALTAVLGILLLRGGFVPGLTGLDTSAQIVAWAVVFGFAQQLFTRIIDRQLMAVTHWPKEPATSPAGADPPLDELRAQVSAAVSQSLAAAWQEPPAAAYAGRVVTRLLNEQGDCVERVDGSFPVRPVSAYRLDLQLTTETTDGEAIAVDGEVVDEVLFEVAMDATSIALPAGKVDLVAPASGTSEVVPIRFSSPVSGTFRLFVYIMQRGRLNHVTAIDLTVTR